MQVTTAERAPRYWIVDVEDEPDLEKNMPGYRKRFMFDGPDAKQKALICRANAEAAGFKTAEGETQPRAKGKG